MPVPIVLILTNLIRKWSAYGIIQSSTIIDQELVE